MSRSVVDSGSCWFTVGVRTGKVPVWGPNVIGMMLSLLQLASWLRAGHKGRGAVEGCMVHGLVGGNR